jgi:hypothetical protein
VTKQDATLIELFIKGYAELTGVRQLLRERPDEIERRKKAVDAIAEDEQNRTTAIEHTLVQPFEGQKSDDQPFNAVFRRLQDDQSLLVPGVFIELWSPAFAIPQGVDWNKVGDVLCAWLKATAPTFARDAESAHMVPGLPFELPLRIQTMIIPDSPGLLSPGRIMPKDRPFGDVVRTALSNKLPKLVATRADKRILLLEDASMALGLVQVTQELDARRGEFPQLEQVDAVWVCKTATWAVSRTIWFFKVWPGGVSDRFKIDVDTGQVGLVPPTR